MGFLGGKGKRGVGLELRTENEKGEVEIFDRKKIKAGNQLGRQAGQNGARRFMLPITWGCRSNGCAVLIVIEINNNGTKNACHFSFGR